MMRKGCLFVVSGPSGVGKGTVVKRVLDEMQGVACSISCTTRAPRTGEKDGREYFFISNERFDEMIEKGEFLEHAHVHGNRYGTPIQYVEHMMETGCDVILEIDVQGGLQVQQRYPQVAGVFVISSAFAELKRRLIDRGTETAEQIELRLRNALGEAKMGRDYRYLLLNDDLDEAVLGLKHIICGERQKTELSRALLEQIIGQIEEDI